MNWEIGADQVMTYEQSGVSERKAEQAASRDGKRNGPRVGQDIRHADNLSDLLRYFF